MKINTKDRDIYFKSKILILIGIFLLSVSIVFAQQESGQATTGAGTIGPAGKILNDSAPSYMVDKSNDYIKSFVGSDYFHQRLTLIENKTFQSGTGEISYIVSYSYDLPFDYLASPNPGHVSVSLDKNGNIIDYLGPKKPHTFSITKEQAVEIAKQDGLKEPITAEIDRVLASNSIDSYVWVVTGAVDQTTCKDIGGTQECLIPGRYLDVDNGSIIGGFNRSSLIREPVENHQRLNKTSAVSASSESFSAVVIVLLIVVFIIRYEFKIKK